MGRSVVRRATIRNTAGYERGIGTVIVQFAPTGPRQANGTRCPDGGMGMGMRWFWLKADENVSGGEGDDEDECGGPPDPIEGGLFAATAEFLVQEIFVIKFLIGKIQSVVGFILFPGFSFTPRFGGPFGGAAGAPAGADAHFGSAIRADEIIGFEHEETGQSDLEVYPASTRWGKEKRSEWGCARGGRGWEADGGRTAGSERAGAISFAPDGCGAS